MVIERVVIMANDEKSNTGKMRKLFAENALDVEQLDGVAGGGTCEMSDDSCFLNVLLRGRPGQCDRYGDWKSDPYSIGYEDRVEEVKAAWASVGVTADIQKGMLRNRYYINGKTVTRDQAWTHAQQVVGKTLKRSDWYWE